MFSLSAIQSPIAASPGPVWSPISFALVRHIPRSARPACATHLSKLFRSVVAHPEVATNWLAILEWGGSILAPPIRGGKRHNFTSVIKKRVSDFSYNGSNTVKHARDGALKSHSKSHAFSLAQAVAAKLEDGNLRVAIRLLNSDDTPAAPSEENLRILQDKHPLASGTCVDLLAAAPTSCLVATDSEVRQAVLSFPAGSSGGPGWFATAAFERISALPGVRIRLLGGFDSICQHGLGRVMPQGDCSLLFRWPFVGSE